MKNSRTSIRRLLAVAPAAMLIGLGALIAACGNNESPAPSSTTTTTTTTTPTTSTTAPSVTPTEKGLSPTGGNLFTPPVKAEPAPTEPPGVHRK
jgi:hypothetical protein